MGYRTTNFRWAETLSNESVTGFSSEMNGLQNYNGQAILNEWVPEVQKFLGGGGTYLIVSSLGSIRSGKISRNPTDKGSENRLGPALPGLK